MKVYRSLLAILLFFIVIYAFRGYINPSSHFSNGLFSFSSQVSSSSNALNGTSTKAVSDSSTASDLFNTIGKISSEVASYSANRDKLPPVLGESLATATENRLTDDGVFFGTNAERAKQSVPELKRSSILDKSAEIKLNDMFSKQYFEHVSPDGSSVSDLASFVGYKFLIVGENLALGNFAGDSKVIAAWMASEGHRANILDKRYTEMGIAVGYGMYKGRMQWLAVQHFARPMSSCSSPNTGMKDRISKNKEDLVSREGDINAMKKIVDATESSSADFQALVTSYNTLVNDYNNKLKDLKTEISNYNLQVNNFNSCLDAVTTSAQ